MLYPSTLQDLFDDPSFEIVRDGFATMFARTFLEKRFMTGTLPLENREGLAVAAYDWAEVMMAERAKRREPLVQKRREASERARLENEKWMRENGHQMPASAMLPKKNGGH